MAALSAVAMLPGCSGATVVNTPETSGEPAAAAPVASSPPPSNAPPVNAFDYAGRACDITGYYFTTPSGKWRCAILTRIKAGCQASSSWQSGLGVEGEPESTNALVVDEQGDPQFVTLDQPEFSVESGTAKALPFNRILA